MIRRSVFRVVAVAAATAVLALPASGWAGFDRSAAAHSAKACGGLTSLTISYNQTSPDILPLWIASDAGYFTQNCLDVSLKQVGGSNGVPALVSGQTQIAGIGGGEAMSAVSQGADLKYFLTLEPTFPYKLWAQPKYASASALKGQRVGITSTVGSLYTGTVVALKKLGLSRSDVQLVPLGSVPNVNAALIAGSIAAAVAHPPASCTFKQQGLQVIANLVKGGVPNAQTGLATQTSYLEEHPAVIAAVAKSVIQGLQRAKQDRDYTEQEMRKYLGITTKSDADCTYTFYVTQAMPVIPMPEVAQLRSIQPDLATTNPAINNVDLASLIDQRFVTQAATQLGVVKTAPTAKEKKLAKLHAWILQQRKKGVSWAKIKKSANYRLWRTLGGK